MYLIKYTDKETDETYYYCGKPNNPMFLLHGKYIHNDNEWTRDRHHARKTAWTDGEVTNREFKLAQYGLSKERAF